MNILITGATSGFGLAMAKLFVQKGNNVIAFGRRKERLAELKNELDENIFVVDVDVRNKADIDAAIKLLPQKFSDIDVLINNAGLALGLEPAQKASREDWQTMIDTNITGLINLTHSLLPKMVENKKGHIVNIGSVAGEFPYPGGNVYGATKAFVHQFSLNLKADLLGTGVRVTCVEPGMCETEFSLVRTHGDKKRADAVYQGMQPLSAQDIAETVEWIINRPAHLNVNVISLMPTDQGFGPFAVHRLNT